ncbi:MAG TPA: hypothetical protein VFH44_05335 [Solirubrobacterales bacterium]|nr:hypothetical protein [Solirubrobacterales bacterium]
MWSTLTRHRPHRGIDLLLGAIALVGAAAWVASISPVLAALLVIGAIAGYLVSLHGQGSNQSNPARWPATPGSGSRDALEALEATLAAAPEIPMTAWIRVEPETVVPLVEEVRAAARATSASDQAERLAQVVLGGRRVPFTDQIRVDRRRAMKALSCLRSRLAAGG